MDNAIPLARGLGSSAAATVAGLIAADALLGGGALTPERMLALAAESRATPTTPRLRCSAASWSSRWSRATPRAVRFDPPPSLRGVLFVPERPLSTAAMRAALPATVPFRDAVHNVGGRGAGGGGARDRRSTCSRRRRSTGSTSRIAPRSTRSCPS